MSQGREDASFEEASTASQIEGAQTFFQRDVSAYEAAHYREGVATFMTERERAYLAAIDRLRIEAATSRAVEAGCGPGFLCKRLLERGYTVAALDTSPAMLAQTAGRCREELASGRLTLSEASIESVPFESAAFDLWVSAGVLEYLKKDDFALREAARLVRPGGYLLISATNAYSHAGMLDGMVEWGKRQPVILSLVNKLLVAAGQIPVRPRHFVVRRHRPRVLREQVEKAGFIVEDDGYFFFLPYPHPFDRLFPATTALLVRALRWCCSSPLGWLSEGYYVVGRRIDSSAVEQSHE